MKVRKSENVLQISALDVFTASLWHAGRWHTASSLHTTHSSAPEHGTACRNVGSRSSIKSTCISVNDDKKPWNYLQFQEILFPKIVRASVILHRLLSSHLLTVSFSLPINHLPPIPPLPCHSDITSHFSRHVCFPSLSTTSGTTPSPAQRSARHPLLPSISACLSRCIFLLIIRSPCPSFVMPEFIPLHQFAPTVNCVENNSGCRGFHPGWEFRQIWRDGNGRQPENRATGAHARPAKTWNKNPLS